MMQEISEQSLVYSSSRLGGLLALGAILNPIRECFRAPSVRVAKRQGFLAGLAWDDWLGLAWVNLAWIGLLRFIGCGLSFLA